MLPSVDITKAAFATGVVPPQPTGFMAIVAAGSTGTTNQPSSFTRDDLVLSTYGLPMADYASYMIQIGRKPVVPVKSTTAVAGAYGSITATGTGTSVCSSVGAPLDEYDILITIVNGGTVGSSGITYTWSADGGDDTSGVQSLPASTPAPVVMSFDGLTLAEVQFGAGTLLAGQTFQCFTTRPQPNNTDLAASLLALGQTRQAWEGVFLDAVYGTGTVGQVDTWLQGLEAIGQFHFAILNTRHKNQPVPTAETETAFATAMQTLTQNDASDRICVGTDAADYTSTLTGISQPRPVAMFLAARAMLIPVGEDPAYTGRGPLGGSPTIADARSNPRWHDEDLFDTLDGLRLVTLRSFAPGGPQGVYITNANVISAAGSDFVWLQHVRTLNLACSIAWAVLSNQLSIGVGKQPADPQTGQVFIQEKDAQKIEGLVNAGFATPLKGQCNAVQFTLARDDDLSSNSSSTVHGTVAMVSLAYLKKFAVTATFTKSIAVKV